MSDQLPRDHDSIRLEYLEEENESLKRERAMLREQFEVIRLASCDYRTGTKASLSAVHNLAKEALSATSEQSAQWLEEHDAEVKRKFATWLCAQTCVQIAAMHYVSKD
jgi:hypothetical protein